MRLWHEALIPYLSTQRLLGQHRECCALRGNGWGRKHATVNYVFTHHPHYLVKYHMYVIDELIKRNIHVNELWTLPHYRGTRCKPYSISIFNTTYLNFNIETYQHYHNTVYPEHNDQYLQECLDLLEQRGEHIEWKSTK